MTTTNDNSPRVRPLDLVVLATAHPWSTGSAEDLALTPLCGRPVLGWCLKSMVDVPTSKAIVVTDGPSDLIAKSLQDTGVDGFYEFLERSRRPRGLGVADSVSEAMASLPPEHVDGFVEADVMILPAWLPLLDSDHLIDLVDTHRRNGAVATLLTFEVADPTGLIRVDRDTHGNVAALVKDDLVDRDRRLTEIAAAPGPGETFPSGAQSGGTEVYGSVMIAKVSELRPALRRVLPPKPYASYLLTDVVEVLASAGFNVGAHPAGDGIETVDPAVTPRALSLASHRLQQQILDRWLNAGVHIPAPSQVYIDAEVRLAPGVRVLPGTVLEGSTVAEADATLGPNTHLRDSVVGARAHLAQTAATDAEIGAEANVGPWVVLKPGASVAEGAQISAEQPDI